MVTNSHSASTHLYDSLAKVMMNLIDHLFWSQYLCSENLIFRLTQPFKGKISPGFIWDCVKEWTFFYWTWTVKVCVHCTWVAFVHSSHVCVEAQTGSPSSGSLCVCVSNEQTGNCVNSHFLWRWHNCPEFHIWVAFLEVQFGLSFFCNWELNENLSDSLLWNLKY